MSVGLCSFFSSITWYILEMSPFKKAAVKGGSSKGKEPVIDVDDYSPQIKGTRSSSRGFDPNKFRSYAAFQSHENYFWNATPLLERPVDQSSLHDTDIPKWFTHKDWNYLLSDLDDAYENLVKEFYANAIVEGEELKCWVRKKSFLVSPAYLVKILHINWPMLQHSPIYDDLCPDEELLKEGLRQDLEFSSNGNSVSVSSLPPKLRVLIIVMFHNLYPLSSTGYMNLGRALFLHDLISDVEIDLSFMFCAKRFYELSPEYVFLSAISFQGSWSSKEFIQRQMNLLAQNRVQSTCIHSMQALVIVGREPNWNLPHLTVVRISALSPLTKNLTTLYHLSTSWVPRCPDSHILYTITALDGIWSLPHYKLNWIRFRGS